VSDFNILKLTPGSIIVDMIAAEKAAQEIHRQSLDPNSKLRNGKVTQRVGEITITQLVDEIALLLRRQGGGGASISEEDIKRLRDDLVNLRLIEGSIKALLRDGSHEAACRAGKS